MNNTQTNPKTLYEELKTHDEAIEIFEDVWRKDNLLQAHVDEIRNYSKFFDGSRDVQRALINHRRKNPVLARALEYGRTIEEQLDELVSKYKGIRNYLPHRKDKKHNQTIKELGELIDEPRIYKTEGIWVFDNPISTAIGLPALLTGCYLAFPEAFAQYLEMARLTPLQVAIPAAALGLLGGIVGSPLRHSNKGLFSQARYLDDKIKNLYR